MTEVLTVLGSVFCLISLFAIGFPKRLLRAAESITITTPLRFLAFVIRILLGIIILLAAGSTQFPLTLKVIGILLIVSGVTLLLLGNSRIQSLLNWFLRQGPNSIRISGVVGFLFGGFLIYAVV